MEKLIITCSILDPSDVFEPEAKGLHLPTTVREAADSVRGARDAGASVVHVHLPPNLEGFQPSPYNMEAWLELARYIQGESDIIHEHGGVTPYLDKYIDFRIPQFPDELRHQKLDHIAIEKPDMIPVITSQTDMDMDEAHQVYLKVTRPELESQLQLCRKYDVKPSFEIWSASEFHNIRWLAERGLADPPYWFTLFIGVRGAAAGPPVIEELLHRIKYLPENSLWQVSVFCDVKGATTQQQLALLTQSITLGGHVRVGMEDNPYYWDSVPAETNAQLVERIVRIARELGREVATPAEARQMLGLRPWQGSVKQQ